MQVNESLTCIAYCLLNPLLLFLPFWAFAHADIVCFY